MKKLLFGLGILTSSLAYFSCKEVDVLIDFEDRIQEDTTYVTTSIETQQDKKYLVEELSGVRCTNCPAGMEKLTDMNNNGEFKDKLVIASIHVGTFAWVIEGYSKQDFVVSGSDQLLELILGGDPGKPCASFDRLDFRNGDGYLVANYNQWPSFVANARDSSAGTPVNIHATSAPSGEMDEYEIKIRLHYTEAVTDPQMLGIYLMEDNIRDAMEYTGFIDTNYIFKHVLRKYITPPTGKQILNDITVGPGRTYEYTTKFKIDRSKANEAMWVAENMKVIVFVNSGTPYKRKVYHAEEINLIP